LTAKYIYANTRSMSLSEMSRWESLGDFEPGDPEAGLLGDRVDEIYVVSIHENIRVAQLVDRMVH